MSQPIPPEPTPGAPAAPPATPPAPSPAPPVTPPAPTGTTSGQDPNAPVDIASLPANVQNLIKSIRAEAAKNRTDPKVAAEAARREVAAQVAKALGMPGTEPPTPDQLARQVEAAQDAAWKATVELAVHRQAGTHATALLDSVEVLNAIDAIDAEPGTPEFDTALATTVQEAMTKRNLTAGQPPAPTGPRPDPTQGSRGTPPANRPTSLTQAYSAHFAAKAAGARGR